MTRDRKFLVGLAVLVVAGLLFALVSAGQRSAWMEGFMMGRLTAVSVPAEAGAVTAMLPYAPYGVRFAHRGPGLGGFFFLLLGLGGLAFLASRMVHRARWHAWMAAHGAPQAEWRGGPPPWMHGGWGGPPAAASQDEPGRSQAGQPAAQAQPGEPGAAAAPVSER